MHRHPPRPLEAALFCVVFLLLIGVLAGCVSVTPMHSWGDGRWGWGDYSGECADFCAI